MITEENFISALKINFPQFDIPTEAEGIPLVVASFFVSYLNEVIETKKINAVEFDAAVRILSELGESGEAILHLVDEIAIGLYDNSAEQYTAISTVLSTSARRRFDYSVEIWKKGNGINS